MYEGQCDGQCCVYWEEGKQNQSEEEQTEGKDEEKDKTVNRRRRRRRKREGKILDQNKGEGVGNESNMRGSIQKRRTREIMKR